MNELIEKPDTVHGRLLESAHIAGYTFERAFSELDWLLEGDRWKTVSNGFEDIDAFLATIKDFSEFKIDAPRRKKIAKKLDDLRATQRATARVLGVDHRTVGRDLGENAPNLKLESPPIEEAKIDFGENAPSPPPFAIQWTRDPESYTPEQYIESARLVMGSIDLDPASNDFANQKVKAATYYTVQDNGLEKVWQGNVFLNPPYKQPDISLFVNKLVEEFLSGEVKQAILLTNNNTDTKWFAKAALASRAICFTQGRINFYKADESITQPTNGQAFFYFGNNSESFAKEFSEYGLIYTLYDTDAGNN